MLTYKKEIDLAAKFLLAAQNEDGGWPYQPGTQSSPEPTCYSLLALAGDKTMDRPGKSIQKGLRWTLSRLNEQGAMTLEDDTEPHWTTSLLVMVLKHLGISEGTQKKSLEWLLQWKGKPIGQQEEVTLNGALVGWPWLSDTFSWVEPTSQAILALKFCGYGNHPRVTEAEQLLFDRLCRDGGWNYGNHTVLGAPLHGYAPTTAWALLALQKSSAFSSLSGKSLTFLEQETRRRPSALCLCMTILCFDVFKKPAADLVQALLLRQSADGSWLQKIHLTGLATLALQTIRNGTNVFRLSDL